jgi:hypothetical protein
MKEKTAQTYATIFDYIIGSEKGKKIEFLDQYKKDTGNGEANLKVLYANFGKLMKQFVSENEGSLSHHSIVKLMKNIEHKQKHETVPVMSSLKLAAPEDYPQTMPDTGKTPHNPYGQNSTGQPVQEQAPPPEQDFKPPMPEKKTIPPELPNPGAHMGSARILPTKIDIETAMKDADNEGCPYDAVDLAAAYDITVPELEMILSGENEKTSASDKSVLKRLKDAGFSKVTFSNKSQEYIVKKHFFYTHGYTEDILA